MAGQYGRDRDLAREKARQLRVQETVRQKEKPAQQPIFGAPIKIHKDDELSKKARSTMGDYDKLKFYLGKNELVAMVGVDQQPQTPLPTDKGAPRFPVPPSSSSNKPGEHQNPSGQNKRTPKQQPDVGKSGDKRLSLDGHVRHKERKNSLSRQRSVSSDRTVRSKGDHRSDSRPPVVKDSKPSSSASNHPEIPSTSNTASSNRSSATNEPPVVQAKPPLTLKLPNRKRKESESSVKSQEAPAPSQPPKPKDSELHDAQFTKPNGVINGLIRKEKPKESVTDENSCPVSVDQIFKEMSCEPLVSPDDIATPKKVISKFSFPLNQKDAISNQLFGPSPPAKTDASPRTPSMGATDGVRVSISTDLAMSPTSDGESDNEEVNGKEQTTATTTAPVCPQTTANKTVNKPPDMDSSDSSGSESSSSSEMSSSDEDEGKDDEEGEKEIKKAKSEESKGPPKTAAGTKGASTVVTETTSANDPPRQQPTWALSNWRSTPGNAMPGVLGTSENLAASLTTSSKVNGIDKSNEDLCNEIIYNPKVPVVDSLEEMLNNMDDDDGSDLSDKSIDQGSPVRNHIPMTESPGIPPLLSPLADMPGGKLDSQNGLRLTGSPSSTRGAKFSSTRGKSPTVANKSPAKAKSPGRAKSPAAATKSPRKTGDASSRVKTQRTQNGTPISPSKEQAIMNVMRKKSGTPTKRQNNQRPTKRKPQTEISNSGSNLSKSDKKTFKSKEILSTSSSSDSSNSSSDESNSDDENEKVVTKSKSPVRSKSPATSQKDQGRPSLTPLNTKSPSSASWNNESKNNVKAELEDVLTTPLPLLSPIRSGKKLNFESSPVNRPVSPLSVLKRNPPSGLTFDPKGKPCIMVRYPLSRLPDLKNTASPVSSPQFVFPEGKIKSSPAFDKHDDELAKEDRPLQDDVVKSEPASPADSADGVTRAETISPEIEEEVKPSKSGASNAPPGAKERDILSQIFDKAPGVPKASEMPKIPKRKSTTPLRDDRKRSKRERSGHKYGSDVPDEERTSHTDDHEWDRKHARRLLTPDRNVDRHIRGSSVSSTSSHHSQGESRSGRTEGKDSRDSRRDRGRSRDRHSTRDRSTPTHRGSPNIRVRDWDAPGGASENHQVDSHSSLFNSGDQSVASQWGAISAGQELRYERHPDPPVLDAPVLDAPSQPSPQHDHSRLESPDVYLGEARRLKHKADDLAKKVNTYKYSDPGALTHDRVAKSVTYVEAVLAFLQGAYAMEHDHISEASKIYRMYKQTLDLLSYICRFRGNGEGDVQDKEKKLTVLSLQIQSLLCLKLYKLKKPECAKLKKVIDDHNSKSAGSGKPGVSAQVPSPWNARVTGTPSPMSPQPSPAGSVGSVGSVGSGNGDYRLANGNLNSAGARGTTPGTNNDSANGNAVSLPARIHSVTMQYLSFINNLYQCHELWDSAMAMASESEPEFFKDLERHCSPLTLHSSMLELVQYVKHGLHKLTDS